MTGSIYDWSLTAASNASSDGDINWAEGQDPDTVNNSARQMMARLAEFLKDSAAIRVSSGSANTYVVTANSAPAALRDGYTIVFRSHQANTTTATLSVNSYGAKPIRSRSGTALIANEILSGVVVVAQYNLATDEFIIHSSPNLWLQTLGPALLQSQTFGLRAGDVKMSFANTPDAGFIRLTETAQVFTRTDYPDLYPAMIAATGYPWGATVSGTTFAVPPAGGYIPRFGATGTTVNPDGVQAAGTTNADRIKAHSVAGSTSAGSTTATFNYTTYTINSAVSGTPVSFNGYGGPFSAGLSVTIPSVAASATYTGAAETSPKTVIFWADMLAVPALVAASLTGVAGHYYRFNSATSAADPGTGYFSLNNATVGSATALYISETDANSVSLATRLAAYASGSSVLITKVGSPQNAIMFTLASTATDNGAWDTFTISSASISGTISNGDACTVVVMQAGAIGPTGPTGSNGTEAGVRWLFASSTSMADPSSGNIRFNNATLSSITSLAVSYSSGEAGNPSVSNFVKSWDDSTNTSHRGTLVIKKASAPQNYIICDLTGSLTDNTTWAQVAVTVVDSSGSFSASDVLAVQWSRAGDKGADGTGAGDFIGPSASSDGEVVLFSGSTGKAGKRSNTISGLLKMSSGVASAALYGTDLRELLSANRTYYVRTDGNDSNTGLADNSGGAFLTIQAAIDKVATLDISIYSVTVQVRTGTYAQALTLKDPLGSGSCILLGDTATLTNCKISPASGVSITANGSKRWSVSGFEFNPTSNAVSASNGAVVGIGANKFNASANGVYCDSSATVNFSANFTIAGGGTTFFNVSGHGTIVCQSVTVTITGTPAFAAAFAFSSQIGYILAQSLTFSGSATGPRYSASSNAVINTGGGGASYFPGNSAGSTATGGVYA